MVVAKSQQPRDGFPGSHPKPATRLPLTRGPPHNLPDIIGKMMTVVETSHKCNERYICSSGFGAGTRACFISAGVPLKGRRFKYGILRQRIF